MKVRRLLLFCIALLLTHTGFGCIWVMGTKYNGMPAVVGGYGGAMRLRNYMDPKFRPDGTQMEAELRTATGLTNRSDYSVALMYLGRYKEAVTLLQQLEKKEPGHYFIAANLGTAYELSGDNTEALHWIQEGIRRNPASHEHTEWLHARILEAKIQQEKDASYFQNHSVLDLNPGSADKGLLIDGIQRSLADITQAIDYQLRERMQFVKPPDAAVAALVFDYAAVEANRHSLESAKRVLQVAVDYGYPPDHAGQLMRSFDRRIFLRKTIQYGGIPAVAVALLWFRRKRSVSVLS